MNSFNQYIKRDNRIAFGIFVLLILLSLVINAPLKDKPSVLSSTEEMLSVVLDMSPALDFSLFSPYTLSASLVPQTPSNVKLNLSVDMGDDNTCWDFKVDGTCASQPLSLNMTYDSNTSSYTRTVYPDQIYPEIFFAPSNITWSNQPLDTVLRRNDYHIFHIVNPFEMVSEMNIWIEFNTVPLSTTSSADLQVYVIGKDQDISYFNSDWLNAIYTQQVGVITKGTSVNHKHTDYSSHHLVRLATDEYGRVGSSSLDISEDFWVVLYSNAPNNSRGWNLRYQPSELCDNTNNWYRGNITGWSTTPQSGCPDAHIHISRRNIDYTDTIQTSVSATYDTGTFTSPTVTFSFNELPNLPPNASSFLTPVIGTRYKGDLNIHWSPATDPNPGDILKYNIYITTTGGAQSTLITNTLDTSFVLNTTLYDDGEYTLQGEVCDTLGLCTNFATAAPFYIDNIVIPETLTLISISSANSNSGWAKDEDIVTIQFKATGVISEPQVDIFSGGNSVSNPVYVSLVNAQEHIWEASYEVASTDTSGQITFEIYSDPANVLLGELDRIYFETTDSTDVIVDVTPPAVPLSSLESGEYLGQQIITLLTESNTEARYTLDGLIPTCDTGLIYDSSITISSSSTLKLISCDLLDNASVVSTYTYIIKESLTSISISSSNSNPIFAKGGDTIRLSFTATNSIATPQVVFTVDSQPITNEISIENVSEYIWVASFTITNENTNGLISFSISSESLYTSFTETTNLSRVTIDTQAPTTPISNISSGTYLSARKISLISSPQAVIRYTLNGSTPTCAYGYIYLSDIVIASSRVLNAISCDLAGNSSPLLKLSIVIFPDTLVTSSVDEAAQRELEDAFRDMATELVDRLTYSTLVFKNEEGTILSVYRVRLLNLKLEPLKYVDVTLYSKPQTGTTGIDGIVTFTDIPVGSHNLIYSYNLKEYIEDIEIKDIYDEGLNNLTVLDIISNDEGIQEDTQTDHSKTLTYAILGFVAILLVILLVILEAKRKRVEIEKEVI